MPQTRKTIDVATDALKPLLIPLAYLVQRFRLDVDAFADHIAAGLNVPLFLRAMFVHDLVTEMNESKAPDNCRGYNVWLQSLIEAAEADEMMVFRFHEIDRQEMLSLGIDLNVLLQHLKYGLDKELLFEAIFGDFDIAGFNARKLEGSDEECLRQVAEYNASLAAYNGDVESVHAQPVDSDEVLVCIIVIAPEPTLVEQLAASSPATNFPCN